MKDFYEEYWKYRKKTGYLSQKKMPDRLKIVCSMIKANNDKSGINVLDVGCGEGGLGMLLKEMYVDEINIFGVDISEEALELAKPYYNKIIQVDIENENINRILQGQKFDYIVAVEILEHLVRPERLLKKLKTLLKPEGYFIVSFPNFAFWRYRIECLLGRFPDQHLYSNAEHIQYWTYPQFIKFLNDCGLEVVDFDGDFGIPFSRFIPERIIDRLGKILPNLFGYQIVFKTKLNVKEK